MLTANKLICILIIDFQLLLFFFFQFMAVQPDELNAKDKITLTKLLVSFKNSGNSYGSLISKVARMLAV